MSLAYNIPDSAGNVKDEKIEKYGTKKRQNLFIAKKMALIGEIKRSNLMNKCSDEISFYYCPVCNSKKIKRVNLCRDRLCPVCSWRLALKRYADMKKTIEAIDLSQYQLFFLTLTVRNVNGNELSGTLTGMSQAFNRLLARKSVKENLAGWCRSVEITYNQSRRDFHPHYHVILLAKDVDFIKKANWWITAWKECLRISYNPIVDIREITSQKEDDNITKAILETFKYTIKDKALINMPLEDFRLYVSAIKNKRLTAYGGIIKQKRAELCIVDDDKAEEIEVTEEKTCCGNDMLLMLARWSFDSNQYNNIELELI